MKVLKRLYKNRYFFVNLSYTPPAKHAKKVTLERFYQKQKGGSISV